jgi:hypothetical protein
VVTGMTELGSCCVLFVSLHIITVVTAMTELWSCCVLCVSLHIITVVTVMTELGSCCVLFVSLHIITVVTVVTELMLCCLLFVFYYSGNKYDGVWVTGVSSLSAIFHFIVTTRLTWRENPRQLYQNTQLKKQFEQV